jgi:hypothetical protein
LPKKYSVGNTTDFTFITTPTEQVSVEDNLNDYLQELSDDAAINDLRQLCFLYLDDPTSISHIEDILLEIGLNFLNEKFEEIRIIKESFGIELSQNLLYHVSKTMDEITINGSVDSESTESNSQKFVKEVNRAYETLALYHGIISKIMSERGLI